MEPLPKIDQTVTVAETATSLGSTQEKAINQPGWEFYDAVANMIGLVALLNDHSTAEPDLINVHHYLSIEAGKLDLLVNSIRGLKQ